MSRPSLGTLVGGQAVIEGVMMRAPWGWNVTCRDPQGTLVHQGGTLQAKDTHPPFIRGMIILWETLQLGIKALHFSAQIAGEEDKPLTRTQMVLTLLVAFLFGLGLFFFLPLLLTQWMGITHNLLFNGVDGMIRLGLFLLYLVAIGWMKDIHRLFAYHGAEHQVVHCYEAGDPLTVEKAKKHSRFHPRCGTSFLLLVVLVSHFFFVWIPSSAPLYLKGIGRILLLPLIAGTSYELLRLGFRHYQNPWFRPLLIPGLWLQRLTTRPPDEAMLEVALHSLQRVLAHQNAQDEAIL